MEHPSEKNTPVQVPLSSIPSEGLSVSITAEPSSLELSMPGARFIEPVSGDMFLEKAGDAVNVTGQILTSVMFECVRCLREFLQTYDIPVNAQYLSEAPSVAHGEHVMPVEEAEAYYYHGDVMVLDDLLRQEVLLALPIKPLCREDCRGLCPQCGEDLNVRACSCAPPIDPRLAPLQQYFKKRGADEGNAG